MGPVFQLVFVSILYLILASILGLAFVSIARLVSLLKQKKTVAVSQFFWFPIKLAPYFLLAIIINVVVCEFIRKVDPPLTDYWSLPVSGDLSLGAIDAPDKWNLWPSPDGGEAMVSDIVMVGISNDAIFGETESNGYFVYRIKTDQRIVGLSEEGLKLEMNMDQGGTPNLLHPSEYYYNNRNLGDLATLLVILVYPLYRFYSICYAFWKRISSRNNEHVESHA
ncbi:hypothetical protein [Shewanella sedimentimangrovi]|uniref:Uncharacterized protein n=1 Tax=Shewanella sedimentimangrovi TaxID=2814293 RepID=A0ABX7R7A9_9GAMM|nr:hypothetical protein [Shewanella sedimentimangrovi]QSX38663.1 hypothetical protein JYB85_07590 [Shewanella sedimentimangrovi]